MQHKQAEQVSNAKTPGSGKDECGHRTESCLRDLQQTIRYMMKDRWLRQAEMNGATHVIIMRDLVTDKMVPQYVRPHEHLGDVCEAINERIVYMIVEVLDVDSKHP
ncbi:MAG: hypothetical protein KAV87_30410 [Desulfobacteraceae bacterium]|nr:hypothetical protein [Desulfobacteraceae bacterium]